MVRQIYPIGRDQPFVAVEPLRPADALWAYRLFPRGMPWSRTLPLLGLCAAGASFAFVQQLDLGLAFGVALFPVAVLVAGRMLAFKLSDAWLAGLILLAVCQVGHQFEHFVKEVQLH